METQLKPGDILDAEVTKITDFGAFVKLNGGRNLGLIHISQIHDDFVKNINEHLKIGDKVRARVIKLGPGKKIDLSLKNLQGERVPKNASSGFKSSDFEEKLKSFLKSA
jgi:S1 RNA binding domain protein